MSSQLYSADLGDSKAAEERARPTCLQIGPRSRPPIAADSSQAVTPPSHSAAPTAKDAPTTASPPPSPPLIGVPADSFENGE
jgi:hypothetical protein